LLVVNAFKQTLSSKTKWKEEEYGKSYFIEFVFGDSLGIYVFNLNIGRLFSTSEELRGFCYYDIGVSLKAHGF
jgi:hypothetical protein